MASNGEHVFDNNNKSTINKSPKRRRDADQKIIDHFWLICDPNQVKRNNSIKAIIQILVDQNETKSSSDLWYCVERLVRGMASARQFARHGFCALLTELLCIFEDKVSLESVYSLSEKHLGKNNEFSNHDSVIGWSLIIASVLRTKRLTFDVNEEIWEKTFDILYTLGLKKPYIELIVCQLIRDFIVLLVNKKDLFKKIVWNKLENDLKSDNKYKPFVIYVCLTVLQHFDKFCEKNKEISFMLKPENFGRLSIVIKETTGYQPLVHPMNNEMIKALINNSETNFIIFWQKIVEETLFSPNQIEKGLLGFEFIKIALPLLRNVEDISQIVSTSFIRLFIQSLSVKTHPLHNASLQLCEFFIDFTKRSEDSKLQIAIVSCFIRQPGSILFDDISKSKFFSNLLKTLNTQSIKEWINRLKTTFLITNKVDSNDILRIRCVQQISYMTKSITSNEDNSIVWPTVEFLFFHAYFVGTDNLKSDDENLKSTIIPITEKLRNACKDSFRSAFNHLLHLDSKTTKEKLLCEVQTLSQMVKYANYLIETEEVSCLSDPKFFNSWNAIMKKLLRLSKKLKSKPLKQNEIQIFTILYSMLAMQLFEEHEEIEKILPDLNECMKRAIDEKSDEESDSSSPVWSDVLTDLILSMLATSSKFTKNLLMSSFKHICNEITGVGIQRLIDAIIPSEANKLFNEESDSDNDSDVDELNDKSESESDSSEVEEDENAVIDEKFRNDITNALGPAAQNDDDEESVYLSDSEMFQIDETLSAVFQSKFNNKKESFEKQQSIIIFRIRCLELIHIFLSHKEISVEQVFLFIQPIVSVAKSSSQQLKQNQLTSKSIQLIIDISKLKDLKTTDQSIELENIKQVLQYLLSVLAKTSHSDLQKALYSLLNWTINISKKVYPNDKWFIEVIELSLKSFFEKNNCQISSNLFKSLIGSHNEIGFDLFKVFLDYSFREGIRPFKKSAAIEILLNLCKNKDLRNNSEFTLNEHLITIRENTIKVLCNELQNEPLKAQYVSELLKLFELTDKHLKEVNANCKISTNDYQELSTKLRALTRQKRKKLNSNAIIKKLIINEN